MGREGLRTRCLPMSESLAFLRLVWSRDYKLALAMVGASILGVLVTLVAAQNLPTDSLSFMPATSLRDIAVFSTMLLTIVPTLVASLGLFNFQNQRRESRVAQELLQPLVAANADPKLEDRDHSGGHENDLDRYLLVLDDHTDWCTIGSRRDSVARTVDQLFRHRDRVSRRLRGDPFVADGGVSAHWWSLPPHPSV